VNINNTRLSSNSSYFLLIFIFSDLNEMSAEGCVVQQWNVV